MFVLIRRITRLAWLSGHADSDTAKTVEPEYLKVTVDLAREWLETNTKVSVITGAYECNMIPETGVMGL